jgi:hypothetical protein
MSTKRKVLVSPKSDTEKEVFDYEVDNLIKQGWKLKEKLAQPKKDNNKINKP